MINNAVSHAKKQLAVHAEKGAESRLSIFEVAKLMDMVRHEPLPKKAEGESIFFSFSEN
jgi:hypothetical protein